MKNNHTIVYEMQCFTENEKIVPKHDTAVQFTMNSIWLNKIIAETQSRMQSNLGVWQNSGD